jgi:LacI family transcriptional regulator
MNDDGAVHGPKADMHGRPCNGFFCGCSAQAPASIAATLATLRDIAAAVGVSNQTVSSVLAGKAAERRIAPATAAAVLAAAERLGYRPHSGAQAIRSGRFHAIALILGSEPGLSWMPPNLLNGILAGCDALGVQLTVCRLSHAALGDGRSLPLAIRRAGCDGLLFGLVQGIPPQVSAWVAGLELPTVWINRRHGPRSVTLNDADDATAAVQRWAAAGRRRIAYLRMTAVEGDGADPHPSLAARRKGYLAGCVASGLQPILGELPHTGDPVATMATWLANHQPDAVLAYSEASAHAVLHAASRLGRAVPEALTVAAFCADAGAQRWWGLSGPTLPLDDLGRTAVELLAAPPTHRQLSSPWTALAT